MLLYPIILLYLHLDGQVTATETNEDDLSFQPRGRIDLNEGLRIKAHLTSYRYEQSTRVPMDRVEVEEQHSRALKSAHFRYRRLNEEDTKDYEFYSLNRQHIVEVNRTDWSCKRRNHESIFLDLILSDSNYAKDYGSIMAAFSSRLASLSHEELIEPDEQVVGIARVILLFDLNKHKLKPYGYELYIREQLAKVYEIELKLDNVTSEKLNTMKIIAFFGLKHELTMTESDIPMRFEISLGIGGPAEIMVDILRAEPLEREQTQVERQEFRLSASTVDPRFGCAEVLSTLGGVHNLQVPRVASMHFQAIDMLAGKLSRLDRQFVAYDGHLMAFRRDVISDLYYSTTIHDLKREKKFNVRRLSQQGADGCIVAQTTSSTYEPIFPLVGLVFLGTAHIRGVEVDVYEHESCGQLPALFYSRSSYVDQNGGKRISDNEQYLRLVEANYNSRGSGSLRSLSVIYYFARSTTQDESGAPGPLMQVEVYLGHSGRMVSQIVVHQFSWSLQQAPDGDQAHELFVLPKECASEMGSSAQLKLKLSFKREHNKLIEPSELNSIYLQDSRQRDYAIKSSLALQTNLATTQMINFRASSQLISTPSGDLGDLQIFIVLDLIQVSQHAELHLSQPSEVGPVRPRKLSKPGRRAANFEECFFEAAHERKMGPLLFAFIDGQCYIDRKPLYEPGEAGGKLKYTYSNLFDLLRGAEETGPKAKEILVETVKLIYGNLENQLRGKILVVPVHLGTWCNGTSSIQTAIFDIAQVEMQQIGLMAAGEHSSRTRRLLDGLRLSQGDLISSGSFAYKTSTENLEQCHAICLADSNCRSFSICTLGSEIQCMTSALRLDSADTLRDIEQQQQQQQKESKQGRKNDASNVLGGKLTIDKRCRTFRKKPLKMFHALGVQIINLSARSIVYAESQDECALKCLAANDMKQLRLKLKSSAYDHVTSQRNSLIASLESRWCSEFYYIPLETLDQHIAQKEWPEFMKILAVSDEHTRLGGVCSMDTRLGQNKTVLLDQQEAKKFYAKASSFQLNFESLYERKLGVRLRGYHNEDEQTGKIVHNNVRFVPVATPELCARACFMQTGELVPVCKSFDFTQIMAARLELDSIASGYNNTRREFWQKRYTTAKRCVLNSMTLAEAKSSGHYERMVQVGRAEDEDENVIAWHFEPREAYSLDDLITRQAFDRSLDDLEQKKGDSSIADHLPDLIINLLIVGVAITSGLMLAQKLVPRIIISSFSRSNYKRESIVTLSPLTSTASL